MVIALGILLALVAACPGRARAAVTYEYLVSFDVVDSASSTDVDLLGVTTTIAGGASDADVQPQTSVKRAAADGGTDTSGRALKLDLASGEQGYIAKPSDVTLNNATVGVSFALHIPTTLPTGERRLVSFRESSSEGCNFRIQAAASNKSLIKAYYGTTDLSLTSREAVYVDSCSSDPALGCYSAAADCPGGDTCGGTYWAELEFEQISLPGTQNYVACELWFHGRKQWATTFTTVSSSGAANVTDVWVGMPGTESVALLAYLDDLVVSTGDRARHGFVGFLAPTADGAAQQWGIDNCGVGATYYQCVDDYASAGQPGSGTTDTLKATKTYRSTQHAFADPDTDELDGITIDAVSWHAVGRTSAGSSGTWTLSGQLATCPDGDCTPLAAMSANVSHPNTTPLMLVQGVENASPNGIWTATDLADAQLTSTTLAVVTNESLRMSALALQYYARHVDPQISVSNLSDHSGDDDLTLVAIGDSLAAGTAAASCSNAEGLLCNQDSYCSQWSFANGYFQDLPTGGCDQDGDGSLSEDDVVCQTCTGRRAASPSGVGFRCTSNGECPVAGTCNVGDGECADNANVPCSTDAECALGGACDTTATCNDACPGTDADGSAATCPSSSAHGSWAYGLQSRVLVDNFILCGKGGERLYEMIENRWALDVAGGGDDAECSVVKGTNAPADYIVLLEGANDLVDIAEAPTCNEPQTLGGISADYVGGMYRDFSGGYCRDNCTATQRDILCDADADCSTISSDAKCVGATDTNETSANGYPCIDNLGTIKCSMDNIATTLEAAVFGGGCNADADCNGGTCSINDTTSQDIGWCSCTADAQCGSGFKCVGTKCRRTCSVDGDCTTTTRSGACIDQGGGVKVCAGRCTCPCTARTCVSDDDCARRATLTSGDWHRWEPRGQCVAGVCTSCGPSLCPTANAYAYAHTADLRSAQKYADMLSWMAADLERQTGGTLVTVEHTEYAPNDGCHWYRGYTDAHGYLRHGSQKAAQRGLHIVSGRRNAFFAQQRTGGLLSLSPTPTIRYPSPLSAGLTVDLVHYSVDGAEIVKDALVDYLNSLGACALTTGTPQYYCYDTVTDAYIAGDSSCDQDTDCDGAREMCAVKPCSSDSDCPATGDSCNAE